MPLNVKKVLAQVFDLNGAERRNWDLTVVQLALAFCSLNYSSPSPFWNSVAFTGVQHIMTVGLREFTERETIPAYFLRRPGLTHVGTHRDTWTHTPATGVSQPRVSQGSSIHWGLWETSSGLELPHTPLSKTLEPSAWLRMFKHQKLKWLNLDNSGPLSVSCVCWTFSSFSIPKQRWAKVGWGKGKRPL